MRNSCSPITVRLAWTSNMYGGEFKGRQPESLNKEEWGEVRKYLLTAGLFTCLGFPCTVSE